MGSETVRMIEELEGRRGSTSINEMTFGLGSSSQQLQTPTLRSAPVERRQLDSIGLARAGPAGPGSHCRFNHMG